MMKENVVPEIILCRTKLNKVNKCPSQIGSTLLIEDRKHVRTYVHTENKKNTRLALCHYCSALHFTYFV